METFPGWMKFCKDIENLMDCFNAVRPTIAASGFLSVLMMNCLTMAVSVLLMSCTVCVCVCVVGPKVKQG